MANRDDDAERPKPQPGHPDYVGPGHPPRQSRIRPTEVRNPWGRAGKPRPDAARDDFARQMAELISQPIRSKDGQTFTQAQVILNGLLKAVSEGDVRAAKFYVELCEKYLPKPTATDLAALADGARQSAIDEALARVAAKRARHATNTDDDMLDGGDLDPDRPTE
jgi:hypothetical protein